MMDLFLVTNGELHCENVPVRLIAGQVGMLAYVYSKATLLHHYRQIAGVRAVNPTICYSIKSCGTLDLSSTSGGPGMRL